jgi:hypothetical protein
MLPTEPVRQFPINVIPFEPPTNNNQEEIERLWCPLSFSRAPSTDPITAAHKSAAIKIHVWIGHL